MRAVVAHGLFLLAAGAYAAHVWLDRATPRGDAPVLLDAEIDELESAEYRWPLGSTRVLREGEGKGRVYVVTLTHRFDPAAEARKSAAMGDPKNRLAIKSGKDPKEIEAAAVAAAPAGELVTESKTFPPGLFPIATIQKLTPFRARRSLGGQDAAAIAGMGLDAPQRGLVVAAAGERLEFEIGNETYGGQAFYARKPGDDEVFLLDADFVRTLETTPRAMMDSRIVTVALSDVTALTLEAGGRRAEFVHRNKDQFRVRHFAPRGDPARRVEALDALMSSFVGLKTLEFREAPPASPALATVIYEREDAPPYAVSVHRREAGEGYVMRAGRWTAEVGEAEGRTVLEQVRAALTSG